jgi:hypothetical protein
LAGKTTVTDVETAVKDEIGASPMVTEDKIQTITIQCGDGYEDVPVPTALADCPSEEPVRVTVTYKFELILNIFFNQPIILSRSAEMMVP